MADLLIRDVPPHIVEALDAAAKRLGLSRAEVLRRYLAQAARPQSQKVDIESLRRFAEVFADLEDADVMAGAWR